MTSYSTILALKIIVPLSVVIIVMTLLVIKDFYTFKVKNNLENLSI